MNKFTCVICNNTFFNKGYYRKTCSRKCRNELIYSKVNRKVFVECLNCKKIFGDIKYRKRKFCSKKCAYIYLKNNNLYISGNKGIKHTEETRKKMCKPHKMIKENITQFKKGQIPFNKGKKNIEIYGIEKAQEISIKISNSHLHKKVKKIIKGKKIFFYKDIYFRSSWEVEVAKLLDEQKIKWEYEYFFFDLGNNIFYTPDFYLPNERIFIEVKGWWDDISKEKRERFRKWCKDNNYIYLIIDKNNYNNILNKTWDINNSANPSVDELREEEYNFEYLRYGEA